MRVSPKKAEIRGGSAGCCPYGVCVTAFHVASLVGSCYVGEEEIEDDASGNVGFGDSDVGSVLP